MHNFQVQDYHTYYVSRASVLVHNECPNPNGRKGGEAHQKTTNELEKQFTQLGYPVKREYKVSTPGGYKNTRYLDLYIGEEGSGFGVQVGRLTGSGIPVARERRAIYDILNAGIKAILFVEY